MPVPKRRKSKSKSRMRRTHYGQTPPILVHCSQCDELKLPHHVCPNCGTYRGRQVIELTEK